MQGQKLHGSYALVRTSRDPAQWLLIKHPDDAADRDRDVTNEDRSVISGMSLAEIAAGARPAGLTPQRRSAKPRAGHRPADLAPREPSIVWPADLAPMLPSLVSEPFSDPAWTFEPKLDGVRALVFRQGGAVILRSRNGLDVTDQYPTLAREVAESVGTDAVLDGEIVALDAKGRPSFQLIQKRLNLGTSADRQRADRDVPVCFFAFDLLFHGERDVRALPLEDRRALLATLIEPTDAIRLVPDLGDDGGIAYRIAVEHGFEGLVAKRLGSRYESGQRSRHWLKIKSVASDDFLILGYTGGTGHRIDTFGSLLLGTRDDQGTIRYAGNVGTGFTDRVLRDVLRRLEPLGLPAAAVDATLRQAVKVASRRTASRRAGDGVTNWVKPELVAEVKYANWTDDGRLRAPVFLRLRDDKPAIDVQRQPVVERPSGATPAAAPRVGALPTNDPPDSVTVAAVLEQLAQSDDVLTLTIAGEMVKLTSLNKVLWPKHGRRRALTKRNLIRYYVEVSPFLLPHLRDRPLSLLRYPTGITGQRFFQKHWEGELPPFVDTVAIYSEHNDADGAYLVCNNLATLVWLGQIAALELHAWFSRTSPEPDGHHLGTRFAGSLTAIDSSLLNYPDFLVFDLDPYIYAGHEGAGEEPQLNRSAFRRTCELAHYLREVLEGLGMATLVKTTGRTGLHVFAPIVRTLDFAAARNIAETIAEHLRAEHPKLVTTDWAVKERTGRIFFDFNMNGRGKTVASIYSPRNLPEAAVSVPLRWDELDHVYPTGFTIATVPARLSDQGDLWAPMLASKTDIAAMLQSDAA
jgi:bifunctional non-homologous end joining protein LigD